MTRRLVSTTAVAAAILLEAAASSADPTTTDCISANEAVIKLRSEHKLRAERSQLLVCAAPSCPEDVRKECFSREDEVNAQIPTVVFTAKDASGADLTAVKVSMDGEVLAERLEGIALTVDPGEHAFTFEVAGQPPLTKKLLIVQGEKDRREAIALGAAPGPTPGDAPPPAPDPGGGLGTQKVLALVAGGLGVVGVGVGAAFGLIAMSQKNDAASVCPTQCASQDGVNKWSTAGSSARIADIGFIVGGVGLVGGAVLWFTAPSASPSTPQVGLAPGSLQVKGTW